MSSRATARSPPPPLPWGEELGLSWGLSPGLLPPEEPPQRGLSAGAACCGRRTAARGRRAGVPGPGRSRPAGARGRGPAGGTGAERRLCRAGSRAGAVAAAPPAGRRHRRVAAASAGREPARMVRCSTAAAGVAAGKMRSRDFGPVVAGVGVAMWLGNKLAVGLLAGAADKASEIVVVTAAASSSDTPFVAGADSGAVAGTGAAVDDGWAGSVAARGVVADAEAWGRAPVPRRKRTGPGSSVGTPSSSRKRDPVS